MFDILISILSVIGFLINLVSIVILCRKKEQHLFHHFLKVLAFYDCIVVTCCGLSYGLRTTWTSFGLSVYPFIAPYIVPINHIAIVSSVYCTLLISFERYIRICYLCQLRTSEALDKIKYFFIAIVIVAPILFYIPKFFELQTVFLVKMKEVNCSRVRFFRSDLISEPFIEKQIRSGFSPDQVQRLEAIGRACSETLENEEKETYSPLKNVSLVYEDQWTIGPTKLRKDSLYYTLYYVHLNVLYGSLLPLVGLLYFNIATMISLMKMIRRNSYTAQPLCIFPTEENPSLPSSSLGDQEEGGGSSLRKISNTYKFPRRGLFRPRFIYSSRDTLIQKERRLTLISLCVISVFILCHIWKVIPTIVEASYSKDGLDHSNWPRWVLIIEKISHTMISLNSVINFLLYVIL